MKISIYITIAGNILLFLTSIFVLCMDDPQRWYSNNISAAMFASSNFFFALSIYFEKRCK